MNKEDFLIELGRAIAVDGRVNIDRYCRVLNLIESYISKNFSKQPFMRRAFVNVYSDAYGRYLGDVDYESYEEAYSARDKLSTYTETIEIVSRHGEQK